MVNKIKAEMKDPALVHDRLLIEYYVAQYVRTKAELTRALKKGIIEAKEALLSLEEHKETIEELYSEVFSKYASYSRHDDLTFQEVDKLLEANRLYEKNNKCLLVRSSTELETDLSKYLKSLEEYKIQLPDFTSVLRETYGLRDVAAYIDIATSSHASVEPNILAGLDRVLERGQPKLHFSFTSILEQAREKEPKLLQELSREEKSDFRSVIQNFRDQNEGGVIIAPRVNFVDSTHPNFSKIMNNAFAGPGGRTTVNIANIVNATAQTQAGGSIYNRGGGQAAGNSGGADNRGGDDDGGNRYGGGKNAKHANQKAVDSAKEQLKEAVIERDRLKSIANKTAEQREQYEEAKKKVAHLARKASFRGEHHSQNPKGNR